MLKYKSELKIFTTFEPNLKLIKMEQELFIKLFPEIGPAKTRTIIVLQDDYDLPKGEYGFFDQHCIAKNCDCRHIYIQVFKAEGSSSQPLAVISYGWEDYDFYKKWMRIDDPKSIKEFKGPVLSTQYKQSEYAPQLLKEFKSLISDPKYVARLK